MAAIGGPLANAGGLAGPVLCPQYLPGQGLGGGCRVKPVALVLATVGYAASAVIFWPIGLVLHICNPSEGSRIMSQPATGVYPSLYNCFPI